MTSRALKMATAVLLLGSGMAFAQSQYDSLGAPTPAPSQKASPNQAASNKTESSAPALGDNTTAAKPETKSETTGMGPLRDDTHKDVLTPSGKRPDATANPAPSDIGVTPGGLTPD